MKCNTPKGCIPAALVTTLNLMLLPSCRDDLPYYVSASSDNAIAFKIASSNNAAGKSRAGTQTFSTFASKAIDGTDKFLLTEVEDNIDSELTPQNAATPASRGSQITGTTFGDDTQHYDRIGIYAYLFDPEVHSNLRDAFYDQEGVDAFFTDEYLNISRSTSDDGSTTVSLSPDVTHYWLADDRKMTFVAIIPSQEDKNYNSTVTFNWDQTSLENDSTTTEPPSSTLFVEKRYQVHTGAYYPYIDYVVNDNVAEQEDLMYAMTTTASDGSDCDKTVALHFKHILTAIKVELGNGFSDDSYIKEVTFNNIVTGGRYFLNDDDGWTLGPAVYKRSWTRTGSEKLRKLDGKNTFMMLPQKPADNATITVKVYNGTTTKTYVTGIVDVDWEMGHSLTYKISNTSSDIQYFLETPQDEIEFSWMGVPAGCDNLNETEASDFRNVTVKSYYVKYAPNGVTTTGAADWDVVWDTSNDADAPAEWLSVYPKNSTTAATGSGDLHMTTEPIDEEITVYDEDDSTEMTTEVRQAWQYRFRVVGDPLDVNSDKYLLEDSEDMIALRANKALGGRGTKDNPINLSRNNSYGYTNTGQPISTANCYLINKPGWYTFVCTQGNIIKNDETDASAYTLSSSSSTYACKNSYINRGDWALNVGNWKGGVAWNISDDGYFQPTNVEIVWQDAKDLVTNLQFHKNDSEYWVLFEVPEDNFQPGNAVVKISNGTTTYWSWHLWVTPYTLASTFSADPNRKSGKNTKSSYLEVPLGFVREPVRHYLPRESRMIIKQKDIDGTGYSGLAETIVLTQKEHYHRPTTCTYYQWGRKDPFPGVIANETGGMDETGSYLFTAKEKPVYLADGSVDNSYLRNHCADATSQADLTGSNRYYTAINNAIQNPGTFYYGQRWIANCFDLWGCTVYSSSLNPTVGTSAHKTIYDPCPRGFRVPAIYEMPNMTYDGANHSDKKSYYTPATGSEAELYAGYVNTPYKDHTDAVNNFGFQFYCTRMPEFGVKVGGPAYNVYLMGKRPGNKSEWTAGDNGDGSWSSIGTHFLCYGATHYISSMSYTSHQDTYIEMGYQNNCTYVYPASHNTNDAEGFSILAIAEE